MQFDGENLVRLKSQTRASPPPTQKFVRRWRSLVVNANVFDLHCGQRSLPHADACFALLCFGVITSLGFAQPGMVPLFTLSVRHRLRSASIPVGLCIARQDLTAWLAGNVCRAARVVFILM